MRVTIWDLDYYYAAARVNCFNVDAMRISSYHKQRGDAVNFVQSEFDISRPYDVYYIFKEKSSLPNPPAQFYTDPRVRWMGKANRVRCNYRLNRVVLACRPDYLLYPEKNTRVERAEYVQLFDNAAKLLPLKQDYTNTFKDRCVLVSDRYMWMSDNKSITDALNLLQDVQNVSFLHPIKIQKLIGDKELREKFLTLKFTNRSRVTFHAINYKDVKDAVSFITTLREKFPHLSIGNLVLKFDAEAHWDDHEAACRDFARAQDAIVYSRRAGVRLELKKLDRRLDTPYYHLFEELHNWTAHPELMSWRAYLLRTHPWCDLNMPATWDDGFRDLVRQTYINHEFFLTVWKEASDSVNEVPWQLLDAEFKLGL